MDAEYTLGEVQPRGYHLSVTFQPQVRLMPRAGHEFAADLSEIIGPHKADIREDRWQFTQSKETGGREQFQVGVAPNAMAIGAVFPTQAPEWLETRQTMILKNFGKHFQPKHIISSSAVVRGELGIGGDARAFLANQVMHLSSSRVKSIGRPIHVVGLKFGCPPVQKQGTDDKVVTLPSFLTVSIESLAENPNKLYLESEASWPVPLTWDQEGIGLVVDRLGVMTKYVRENLLAFLRSSEGENEP